MKKFLILLQIISVNLIFANLVLSQELQLSEFHFETLQELNNAGAVISGTPELIPGISGNAVNMANSNSICIPAASMINTDQGTLQFWAKDIAPNAGLWQVTSVGLNKLWGALRSYSASPPVLDIIHHEMQTAAGRIGRSSGNWRPDTTWHFLVFTWIKGPTRTMFTLYLDGISASTPNLLGAVSLDANSKFCLGQYSTLLNSHPKIDELKTFNYLRSQAQINTDFSALFSGCPLWPFLWRNSLNPNDVNRDGIVDRKDALYVLSAIASGATYNFTVCPNDTLPVLALDVVGNNILNQQDATAVVNAINASLPPEEQININDLTNFAHGDVDTNGVFNQDDLNIMVNGSGSSVPAFTGADITGDGLVDNSDLVILRKYISQGSEWRSLLPLFKIVRP